MLPFTNYYSYLNTLYHLYWIKKSHTTSEKRKTKKTNLGLSAFQKTLQQLCKLLEAEYFQSQIFSKEIANAAQFKG